MAEVTGSESESTYYPGVDAPPMYTDPVTWLRRTGPYSPLNPPLRRLATRFFQTTLLRLLDRFSNAFPSRMIVPKLPPFRRVGRLIDDLRFLAQLLHKPAHSHLTNVFLRDLPTHILTTDRFARLLSSGYQLFDIYQQEQSKPARLRASAGLAYDADHYRTGRVAWIRALRTEVRSNLASLISGFWIHGSMSTLDYCDFSDLDTLVVLPRETILDSRRLLEFRKRSYRSTRFLYLVDPFQHHGHFVFTEIDQEYFPQTVFPLKLFEFSTQLTDQKMLTFHLRDEAVECSRALWMICRRVDAIAESGRVPCDSYRAKCLLSYILLLPTLFLQAKGDHQYKRDSFALARPYFSDDQWHVVDRASAFRRQWTLSGQQLEFLQRRMANARNPYLCSAIRRNLLPDTATRASCSLDREFLRQSATLVKALLHTGLHHYA